jgi:hypothetical protein
MCPVAIRISNACTYPDISSGNRRETRCRDVVLWANVGITSKHRWHTGDWVIVMRNAIITTSLISDIRAEGVVTKTRSGERVL